MSCIVWLRSLLAAVFTGQSLGWREPNDERTGAKA